VIRGLIRWLIVTLLLANLALFYWLRAEPQQIVETVPAGVKRLVLLEELQAPNVASEAEAAEIARPAEVAPAAFDVDSAEVTTEADSESAGLVQVAQEFAEQALEMAESVLGINTCWLAGPLDQNAVREAVTDALDTQGIQLNLVLQRVAVVPDYWVHLPVAGGIQQQRFLAAELRRKGIDNFSITEGTLSGDLSLGVFRSEEHARSLISKVRAQGYAPEIYERTRSREEAWAALQQADLAALGWEAEAGPLAAYPSVGLIQRDCPD
jgi:hypothetical protein